MTGKLTVYCGPMFAGKTTGLLAEVQSEQEFRPESKIKIFKPSLDDRYDPVDIKTHSGYSMMGLTGIKVQPVSKDHDFMDCLNLGINLVAIDEIQFFNKEIIVKAILRMLTNKIDVVVAGLELDSDANPFGAMPVLLCLADHVEKCSATCCICDGSATRTFRKVKTSGQILVGGSDFYEPRCFEHWLNIDL